MTDEIEDDDFDYAARARELAETREYRIRNSEVAGRQQTRLPAPHLSECSGGNYRIRRGLQLRPIP
jgi:hypothetical protein